MRESTNFCARYLTKFSVDLDGIWSARGVRKRRLLCQVSLTKFAVDLDGIWSTIETSWCDEVILYFISCIQYSRKRNLHM